MTALRNKIWREKETAVLSLYVYDCTKIDLFRPSLVFRFFCNYPPKSVLCEASPTLYLNLTRHMMYLPLFTYTNVRLMAHGQKDAVCFFLILRLITVRYLCLFISFIISSPELKAQVSCSDHNLSVVCRRRCRCCHKLFTFSSSSPEPLDQFQPKFTQSILS